MTEQSRECYEHHMLLKKAIEDLQKRCNEMNCFFFGGVNQRGELSFVDKVNTMYDMMNNNRTALRGFLASSIIVLISWLVGLGYQMHSIQATSDMVKECVNEIQAIKNNQAEMDKRLIILEAKLRK